MSFLKALKTKEKVEAPIDRLGGSTVRPSGVELFKIKNIYFLAADSGAMMCYLTATDSKGLDYRESLCVASGDAKGNSPTYKDKNTGALNFLPGYNIVNALAMLTIETDITDLETETITVKHYSKAASKEIPTEVEVVTDMIGQEVQLAIKHVIKNKQELVSGKYVDVNEERAFNEIGSVFEADSGHTLQEALEGVEPEFKDKWLEKYEGKPFNTYKEVKGGGGGNSVTSGGNKGDADAGKPKKSMFNKK